MIAFDLQTYGPAVGPLLALDAERTGELGPGRPFAPAYELLRGLTPEELVAPAALADRDAAAACLAGLWLYFDYFDESHRLSQDLEGPDGSYWHGILHRREPDPENAKYWFRRVGRHPIFAPLHAAAAELVAATPDAVESAAAAGFLASQASWEPYRWIDLCEAARLGQTGEATQRLCRSIQRKEWELLFAYCYAKAKGGIDE